MRKTVPLQRHLQFAILVPVFIAVALSAAVFIVLQWRVSLHEQEQRLQTLALLVAENGSPALAFENVDDAQRVLDALGPEQSVLAAALLDRQGNEFASYRRNNRSTAAVPHAVENFGLRRTGDRLTIQQPVTQAARLYGAVLIEWDLRPWHARMRSYMLAALGVLAATALIGVLVGRFLQRRVSGPILELANAATTVAAERDYSVRVQGSKTRELDDLAAAFNKMLGTTQDFQTRLAAEAESTRQAEQQLRLIINAAPSLISYIDRDLRYRYVNRQYEVWFGKPASSYIGRTIEEALGAKAFAGLRRHLETALSGQASTFELETPYADGPPRWIRANYIPHVSDAGEVLGVVVLVIDLTERRRIEASLAKAHAELEQYSRTLETRVEERTARLREAVGELEAFSYSIAHDMRAPLRSMQGYSTILLDEYAAQLDPDAQTFLKRITASAHRLDQLIQDVLNYSRVVRQDLTIEPIDAEALLDNIIASYPNLETHRSRIAFRGKIPVVEGSVAALTQVFSNLLSNAVKFVKPGQPPEVQVRAETARDNPAVAGDSVRIWIEDQGIGIGPEAQKRLFGMFQRLHRPELYEGTGIGLAIVRKAVERMGGRVGVVSEEGKGSRFWIELKTASAIT